MNKEMKKKNRRDRISAQTGPAPTVGILVDASCFKAVYEPYFYGQVEWQGVNLHTGEKVLKSMV